NLITGLEQSHEIATPFGLAMTKINTFPELLYR
ncbi:unnamed protein product, partial [marine sediment metagenome]